MDYEGVEDELEAVKLIEARNRALFFAPVIDEPTKPGLRRTELPDTDDIALLAKAAVPSAIRALVDIIDDPGSGARQRIAASSVILDRAFGKAHQSTTVNANVNGAITYMPLITVDNQALKFNVGKVIEHE